MIKAVVFDMDGVLVDAREWHYIALNRALDLFGLSIPLDDHLARFDGLPTSTKLEILSQESSLPRQLHPFINNLKQDYTVDLIQTQCRPVFRQEYALATLKRDGYQLAVASNSIAPTVALMMQRAGLEQLLDMQISASDVAVAKPDPEIYLTACDRLGISPSECLVVEDSQFGIAAAEAAGCHLMVVEGVEDVRYDAIVAAIEAVQ